MKINAWMLCLVGGLAIATTAQAQPGGGRGGRGGMGGGGVIGLAGNEAVQKDLGLAEADVAKVKVVTDEYSAAARESFAAGGRPNFQDMTPEERTKAMEEMQKTGKALQDKFLPQLKAAVTPDQFTRLQQINWQAMGATAYTDAEVVKALTITKEQTDKITALTDDYRAKTRELFQGGGGGGGGADNRAKMQELNKERDAKISEVLTKAQLDAFAKLKGKEFDVAQLGGGRGGPGGGGGGAGARPKRPQPKAE